MSTSTELKPLNTDDFNTDEIVVVDNTSALLKSSVYYNSLDALYPFDEAILLDQSTAGRNLTLVGAPTPTIIEVNGKQVMYKLEGASLQIPLLFTNDTSKVSFSFKFQQTKSPPTDTWIFMLSYDQDDHRINIFYNWDTSKVYFEYLKASPKAGSNFTYTLSHADFLTENTYGISVEDTGGGDMVMKGYFNGTKVGEKNDPGVGHDDIEATARLGCASNGGTPVEGYYSDFVAKNGILADADFVWLHNNTPYKFVSSSVFTFSTDFTDPLITKFISFVETKAGAQTLGYEVSTDSDVTWLRWDGSDWVSTGSGVNTGATLNSNLQFLDATNQKIRIRVSIFSDRWKDSGFNLLTLGYNENVAPVVKAGGCTLVTKGESFFPFPGATINDANDNESRAWLEIPTGTPVANFTKGAYASLEDAVRAYAHDSTGLQLGELPYLLRIEDVLGATGEDDTSVFVLSSDSSKIDDILAQVNKMNFIGDDIKSTLDGEEVTTNTASRDGSKADVSALALEASTQSIKTETDKIADVKLETDKIPSMIISDSAQDAQISLIKTETDKIPGVSTNVDATLALADGLDDGMRGNAKVEVDGLFTQYKKDNTTVLFQKRMKQQDGTASDTDIVKREEI